MSRYSSRPRDFEYMAAVRRLPCCAAFLSPCSGPMEADHAVARGLSRKADDRTCIPLCRLHHRQRTDFSGPFKEWDREAMREFLARAIEETQRAVLPR